MQPIVTPEQDRIEKRQRRLRKRQELLAQRKWARQMETPGRPVGKPHGVYVTDAANLKHAIILCRSCAPKFDARRYQYYRDRRFEVCQGRCDACREHDAQGVLFMHESLLTGPNGYKSFHGHSWIPR